MQQLTLNMVKYAALLLLEVQPTVTTLEVKTLLRIYDVNAKQADVSELMEQAAAELPLEFTTNGKHRSFSLPTPQQVIDDVVAPSTLTMPLNSLLDPQYSYTNRNGKTITAYKSPIIQQMRLGGSTTQLNFSDVWSVTSVDATNPNSLFFDATQYSRDEVRVAFAKFTKSEYTNTRASRVQ